MSLTQIYYPKQVGESEIKNTDKKYTSKSPLLILLYLTRYLESLLQVR